MNAPETSPLSASDANIGFTNAKTRRRIPVRIAIERKPGTPALRAGMSVGTTIDTGRRRTLADLW